MKYRVDLIARTSVVVEANDKYDAVNLAEKYVNSDPSLHPDQSLHPIFEFYGEGCEETEDEIDYKDE